MRRPGVEGRNGVRRGDKKPGTRTCNCKMDQEARAGIVGAATARPPHIRQPRPSTLLLFPRFCGCKSLTANLITPLHSPDAQSVNSGDRLIAAIEQIFVCVASRRWWTVLGESGKSSGSLIRCETLSGHRRMAYLI